MYGTEVIDRGNCYNVQWNMRMFARLSETQEPCIENTQHMAYTYIC